jgi:hypothetical protein
LGTSKRHLTGRIIAGWPVAAFRARPLPHGESRSSHQSRKHVPGVRGVLRLFAKLAAFYDRRRRCTRSHSGKFRQREAIGHALQRRALLGAVWPNRDFDLLHDLRCSPGGLPRLRAGRRRMHRGAATAWPAASPLIPEYGELRRQRAGTTAQTEDYAVTALAYSANSSSSSSSIGAKVESGLVESVIGLRLPGEADGAARAAGSRDKA